MARAGTHYERGHYGGFNNFPLSFQPEYTKTDLTLTYNEPGDRWSAQLFVRNVEGEPVYTTLNPGTTVTAPANGGLQAPRTYGFQLSARWRAPPRPAAA